MLSGVCCLVVGICYLLCVCSWFCARNVLCDCLLFGVVVCCVVCVVCCLLVVVCCVVVGVSCLMFVGRNDLSVVCLLLVVFWGAV